MTLRAEDLTPITFKVLKGTLTIRTVMRWSLSQKMCSSMCEE